MSLLQSMTKNALGQLVALFKDGKTDAVMRSTPQVDLAISGTGWTPGRATGIAYQTANGVWRLRFNIAATVSATASPNALSISGVTFKTGYSQVVSTYTDVSTASHAFVSSGGNSIIAYAASAQASWLFSGDVELDSKPTWA